MSKKLQLLILSLLFCYLCTGCAVNPVTGETQFNMFGPDVRSDVSLGRRWSPAVEKEFGAAVEDIVLQNYIDYVGQSIARASHTPDLKWHFKALNHNSVNAFALPGGYVYVTTGMLKKLNTEAQLAGILAHESAHITLRHATARMSEQIGLDILLSAVIPEDTPRGVVQPTSIARQIIALKYSRGDEKQADMVGMNYMVNAGYSPYGMVGTMQMLQQENKIRPIEFLSSHPAPKNRMAYMTQKIQTKYYNLARLKIGKEDYQRVVLERLDK